MLREEKKRQYEFRLIRFISAVYSDELRSRRRRERSIKSALESGSADRLPNTTRTSANISVNVSVIQTWQSRVITMIRRA